MTYGLFDQGRRKQLTTLSSHCVSLSVSFPVGMCVFVHIFYLFVCFFLDRVSLYSPGCLGTHSVDQAGLELRNPVHTFLYVCLQLCVHVHECVCVYVHLET